ncbi:MAG: hypothetical protein BroJett011_32320 [Chloroflexota bacterium]|nr:MAG: hypothetical protein BroJett011_32320 [Chloroflexota bacterium]
MAERPAAKNPLAFIIEDNESVAEVFKIAIEQAEFETEVMHDGQAALERLATVTPALVLLDLHLPFVSGAEILRHIRTEPQLAKTRVILATADLIRAETLEHQVDFVLTKPFGFTRLYELAKELRASL